MNGNMKLLEVFNKFEDSPPKCAIFKLIKESSEFYRIFLE